MELTGAISEGEWSSLSGNFTAEEAVFMAQLLDTTSSLPTHLSFGGLSSSSSSSSSSSTFSSSAVAAAFWPGPQNAAATAMAGLDEASYYSSERPSPSSFYRFFQDSSDFSGGSCSQFPTENYFLGDSHPVLASSNNGPVAMSFCFGDQLGNNGGFRFEDDDDSMNPDISESNVQPSSQADQLAKPEAAMEDDHNQLENYKKRSRESEEVPKMRNSRSKKAQMVTSTSNTEEDGNGGHSRQSTSNYCSEDESNVSQELNGGANNSGLSRKGPAKTRASRGSATDPQSLYARKRRERINERLKILQSLVPNGTKVDISTMLEEAVQYVKFLQLQIKLLSSDDLWMYAPIAYNGMDIGLNPNPNTLKES